ncbi:autotransporter outer membrane beta-barrel domain-containing protein [Breoghania sp.]|uniref:autotransporter outer membrane beta-barrel domain-containing protein n=1 Tax=Breoghania sp. TaxID=2065378 RepID=UPI002615AB56|nr:autotransporter outer membrane beta-barrel domain-containing protein [Breoghania sp.]MDJ0930744.1 autotransporter outer membrane beta-barrel domain-containing protein [Breoghania sp.]
MKRKRRGLICRLRRCGYTYTAGSNGITLNYTAPLSSADFSKRTDAAFSALGFADDGKASSAAPDSPWNVWASLRGSWLSDSVDSHQINATVGVGYKILPNLVIGSYTGYENFDYDFGATTTTVHSEGDGGSVGAYAGWRLSETVRLDGMVGWSGLSYDVSTDLGDASYDASRWTASGKLSDTYDLGGFKLSPSASLYVFWEDQDSYTDSNSTDHDELDFYIGRASFGGKISKGFALTNTLLAAPYILLPMVIGASSATMPKSPRSRIPVWKTAGRRGSAPVFR